MVRNHAKQVITYPFYKLKIKHPSLANDRVYPFSHTYGENITIRTSPLGSTFLSLGASHLQGVLTEEVTLQEYFGTPNPQIIPVATLTFKNNPLGVRFRAEPSHSAFLFDIELEKLPDKFCQNYLNKIRREEMYLIDGLYVTKMEKDQGIHVVDMSECLQLINYLHRFL